MTWKNKRKVHFARGNSNKIIALSEQTTNYTLDDITRNMFTDGQPLHIKDRNYLAIADTYTIGTTRVAPKLMEPIKTRTLEGYGSDIDSNGNYLLTIDKTSHYKLTGDSQGTYLSSFNDFHLQRETAGGNINLLSLKNDGDKDYILINEDNYLKSNNIHLANIKDFAGNNAISLGTAITLLKDLNTNKNITSNGNVSLCGNTIKIGDNKDITAFNITATTNASGKTIINDSLIINAETTLQGIINGNTIGAGQGLNEVSSAHNLIISPRERFSGKDVSYINADVIDSVAIMALNNITSPTVNATKYLRICEYTENSTQKFILYANDDGVTVNKKLKLSGNLEAEEISVKKLTTTGTANEIKFSNGFVVGSETAQKLATIHGTLNVTTINLITK